MSSVFGNAPTSGPVGTADSDLIEISTEQIGFQAISGDDKLKLLPQPWPADRQPPSSASLLSIAAKKGLVAAAGPDTLVIASTDRLRQAFVTDKAENNTKIYTPQATIQIPRINQLTFSSDESCLVITAEQGGGLAIYDTNALVNGGKEPAFQIGTNGATVRHLLPNPNPSNDLAHYFAIVLDQGQLLLADLKTQKLVNNAQGNPVFHEGVTSACWSRLGKQIVAGRKDGTAVQIDPQGVVKAEIPLPPKLPGMTNSNTVSASLNTIYWLETNDFLAVHFLQGRPPADDMDMMDDSSNTSVFHLIRRDKTKNTWNFQLVVDPSPAYGDSKRLPPHHFLQRLRDWPPSLDDSLVVLSTGSTDVGLLTKSKVALDPSQPVINTFTTTMVPDGRRAGMPLSFVDDISDTSAIGMALDLSVKENPPRPIPADETLDVSPTPLPALYVLNHEGFLKAWYITYNDSIRQKVAYPDLVAAGGPRSLDAKTAPTSALATAPSAASPFGGMNNMQNNGASPVQPSFGSSNASSAFGKPAAFGAASGAFGGSSMLGKSASPWGSPAAAAAASSLAGKPAFGSPSSLGNITTSSTGFGQTATLGSQKQSVWQTSSSGASSFGGPAFGTNTSSQSPFAVAADAKKDGQPQATGFAAFGSTTASPFATAGQPAQGTSQASIFGSGVKSGNDSKPSPFAQTLNPTESKTASPFSNFATTNTSSTSPFASTGNNASAASPFASIGNNASATSPFATIGNDTSKSTVFGSSPFANNNNNASSATTNNSETATSKQTLKAEPSGSTASFSSFASFGSQNTFGQSSVNGVSTFSFGKPSATSREDSMRDDSKPATPKAETGSVFGSGAFKLGTTFKTDGSAATDSAASAAPGPGLFGSSFGAALNDTTKAQSQPVIKSEPGTEDEPKLGDIPSVADTKVTPNAVDPLTYKPQRFSGDVPPAEVPAPAEDPLKYKPKRFAGDVPPSDVPAPAIAEDTPKRYTGDVPPTDVPSAGITEEKPKRFAGDVPPVDVPGEETQDSTKAVLSTAETTVAGSPPVDLAEQQSGKEDEADDLPALDDEDDEEDWDDEQDDEGGVEGEDSEEEEEDDEDAEDEEEVEAEDETVTSKISDPAALSSFMSRITPASPSVQGDAGSTSYTPATEKKPSFTPAGFPKAPVSFGLPSRAQDSPRSPSPQRAVTSPLFSVKPASSPSFGKPADGMSRYQASLNSRNGQAPQRIAVAPAPIVERPQSRSNPVKPEAGQLEDEEDAQVQAILAQKPQPSKDVPHFLAHQNYVGNSSKEGIGGQIERVYRDINSMIDTLGLNAHSLRGFVDGHMELTKSGERDRADLSDESNWALDEISDLSDMQRSIQADLEQGKLDHVEKKKRDIYDTQVAAAQLQSKAAGIRKQIAARVDPERVKQQQNAPLATDARVQQTELRAAVRKIQTTLGEVEDSLSELRARIAAQDTTASSKAPTVEAVINTILKMTAMIEKKSGDVDVLEAQIRRLPNGLPTASGLGDDYEDGLVSAMRGSRLPSNSPRASTPSRAAPRRTAFNGDPLGMSGMFGASRLRTPPDQQRRSIMFSPEASMLGRSVGSLNGSARKKMQDVTDEEVLAFEKKQHARRKILGTLRHAVEQKGVRPVVYQKS